MGKTYRGVSKKFKEKLKENRNKRHKRGIQIEPKERDNGKSEQDRGFYGNGLYD